MRRLVLAILFLGIAFPASGQLQYFGYVGGADDNLSLGMTKGFTNFAHVATRQSVTDPFVRDRVTAMAQQGLKATIDLGLVLWCDYDGTDRYRELCWDWQQRWANWKVYNASILTSDKVLAFAILDEPFNRDANMTQYEQAAARVKADLPWAKLWMVEAACVIALDDCGYTPGAGALSRYRGNLPNIDWIGLDAYGIHPATDEVFQNARAILRSRFPGRKWLYVMDGFYDPNLHYLWGPLDMRLIAREWYDVARADVNSILLGVFLWPRLSPEAMGSSEFPCSVLTEHVRIGRAVTGKVRTQNSLPIGVLESISHSTGRASGWACDPDGTVCERPGVGFYADGVYKFGAYYSTANENYILSSQCGAGIAYRFYQNLGMDTSTSGRQITAVASDLDSGSVTLPSNCPENPACVYYTTRFSPKGYMESISSTGVAAGWACDPDSPLTSNKVRLALDDGTRIGTYTTNLSSEQAVADECGGGYLHRFSVQLPSWARYRRVYAYSQDLVQGEVRETQIPWLCNGGSWYCIWY